MGLWSWEGNPKPTKWCITSEKDCLGDKVLKLSKCLCIISSWREIKAMDLKTVEGERRLILIKWQLPRTFSCHLSPKFSRPASRSEFLRKRQVATRFLLSNQRRWTSLPSRTSTLPLSRSTPYSMKVHAEQRATWRPRRLEWQWKKIIYLDHNILRLFPRRIRPSTGNFYLI